MQVWYITPMRSRQRFLQRQRVIAGLMLALALSLAWFSVTPGGALSCLHCFLQQRWVEGALADDAQAGGLVSDGPSPAAALFLWRGQPVPGTARRCLASTQYQNFSGSDPACLGLRAPPPVSSI